MITRRDIAALAGAGVTLGLIGACKAPAEKSPPQSDGVDPADAIRSNYERYFKTDAQFPPLDQQLPWSKSLSADLLSMQAQSEKLNEPILDFDPMIAAQDWQLSDLDVTSENVVAGKSALVRARFKNADRAQEVIYDMVWEDGAWRVANIRGPDWDLVKIATQLPSAP